MKQEQEEIAIISGYLPKQMSDDEMKAAIEATVKETGAAGMKDMGKVIGVLRGKFAGQMDMAKASGMVKARLQSGTHLYGRLFPAIHIFSLAGITWMLGIRPLTMLTRKMICFATLLTAILVALRLARADEYPSKPIHVLTTSSAGGISDIFMRVLGEELHKSLGQPLIIDNRPGGAGNIAARACQDAVPDGYTICIINADPMIYNQFLFKNLSSIRTSSLRLSTSSI